MVTVAKKKVNDKITGGPRVTVRWGLADRSGIPRSGLLGWGNAALPPC